MKDGIIDGTVPEWYPYAQDINAAAQDTNCSAYLMYAIAETETINGELAGIWDAATVISVDGGHGLFQLTSAPIPVLWTDPYVNARAAANNFILPAWSYWSRPGSGLIGDALVRAIASEYNAGRNNALAGHDEHGDVGYFTSKRPDGAGNMIEYDLVVLNYYHKLLAGKP